MPILIPLCVSTVSASETLSPILKKEFLKGYELSRQEKGEEAIAHYQRVLGEDIAIKDYALYYLGIEYLKEKRCSKAGEAFRTIYKEYPDSRWWDEAARQVKSHESCPPLPLSAALPDSVKGADCSSLASDEAQAQCFFDLRQYPQAKEIFRRLAEKPRKKGEKILERLSQAAARSQDFEMAIWANKTAQSRYPKSKLAREALRKMAFIYQDARQFREAIPLLKQLAQKSRAAQEKRSYWERIGWCHFQLEEYAEAIHSFDQAIDFAETSYSLYWKARSLERLGQKAQATPVLQEVVNIYPGTYYGLRALERLHGKNSLPPSVLKSWWTPVSKKIRWYKESEGVPENRGLSRVHELTSLGLLQDATVEVRRVRARQKIQLPRHPQKIQKKGSWYRFSVRQVRDESQDYPLPYADVVFSVMKEKGEPVDPFLLYGLMRQESRFRERVVSPVGAIGLLQIMPYTGRRLARESGWPVYETSWLYDPITNIELSLQYLKMLENLFGDRWYAIAASYNAGEGAVKEWVRLRQGLPEEEFIEEIPYGETRNYVKKIYANWKAYRTIYGQN